MKILVISHVPRDPTGGAASCTLALTDEWRRQGHSVSDFYRDELPTVRAGRLTLDLMAIRAAPFISAQALGCDTVIITGPLGWLAFRRLDQRRDRPLLVSLTFGLEHDDYEVQAAEAAAGRANMSMLARVRFHALLRPAVESSIAQADQLVAARKHTTDRAIQSGWKTVDSVLVSAWGVAPEVFEFRRPPNKPWDGRIAWCASTVDRKGWRYFREGFIEAARATPELTLDVLGSRLDEVAILRQFPNDVVARIRVHPVLSRTEQFRVLSKADVFVSTSLSEGYHLALQEALAMGVPVIATSEGFIADLAPANRPVREIPKRNPVAVVDAIRELKVSPDLRTELSERGLIWGDSHSWGAVASRLLVSFNDALASRRADGELPVPQSFLG
jgi:glycosyltransferase involved in cell wall biosynthesis